MVLPSSLLFISISPRREWMGCWGLLGWLLIVSQWIIPENSLRLAPVSKWWYFSNLNYGYFGIVTPYIHHTFTATSPVRLHRLFWSSCPPPGKQLPKQSAVIELDDGKIYRKDLYLMVKTMVSCRFSLKPIHWHRVLGTFTGTKPYQHILVRKLLVWMDNLNISWWLKNNMVVVICCLNQSKSQKFIWFTNPEATNPDSSDLVLLGLNPPWTSPFCCFRCDIPTKNVSKN